MNKQKIMLYVVALFATVFTACNKVADLPFYENGAPVTLTTDKNAVAAMVADSTREVLKLTWNNPKYSGDSSTFKYVIEIDSTGRNFTKKVTKTVNGTLTAGFTGRELNNILLNFGFGLGSVYSLDLRVVSSYANNNEPYKSNIVKIAVTPFNDPAVLTGTATSVTGTLATAGSPSMSFNYTPAFKGYTGAITYVLQYDSATKNFANVKEMAIGTNVYTKAMTQGEMNTTALSSGVIGGTTGKIEYRIKATTAQGAVSFSNTYSVTIQSYLEILRMYMAGNFQAATGQGNDWDNNTAPEMIRDLRSAVFNDMYYIYTYLPANSEFKIMQNRDWGKAYGISGGQVQYQSGGNFSVTSAGWYRVTIKRSNLTVDIRAGRMGFVGGATGAGWNPPGVFPTYQLGQSETNLFVGLTTFTTGPWKLIDSDAWDNGSQAANETRSFGANAGTNVLQPNGPNFPDVTAAGRYRVIWDGRDRNNVTYNMTPATEMRVVGDGMNGVPDWNPMASPQMTYLGSGVWTATIDLKADKEIKFLAGNDWGAFDYEDNSGGVNTLGTSRKIAWGGGPNFKTPATAGMRTIVLNENTQTVTIN